MSINRTESPWEIRPITHPDGGFGIYAEAENTFVAIMPWGPNCEEHAHLITKAPELAGLLEEVVARIQDLRNGNVNAAEDLAAWSDDARDLLAAIKERSK